MPKSIRYMEVTWIAAVLLFALYFLAINLFWDVSLYPKDGPQSRPELLHYLSLFEYRIVPIVFMCVTPFIFIASRRQNSVAKWLLYCVYVSYLVFFIFLLLFSFDPKFDYKNVVEPLALLKASVNLVVLTIGIVFLDVKASREWFESPEQRAKRETKEKLKADKRETKEKLKAHQRERRRENQQREKEERLNLEKVKGADQRRKTENRLALEKIKDERAVYVKGVMMPFGEMVVFMLKWALASIPAGIVIFLVVALIFLIISSF